MKPIVTLTLNRSIWAIIVCAQWTPSVSWAQAFTVDGETVVSLRDGVGPRIAWILDLKTGLAALRKNAVGFSGRGSRDQMITLPETLAQWSRRARWRQRDQ